MPFHCTLQLLNQKIIHFLREECRIKGGGLKNGGGLSKKGGVTYPPFPL